MVPKVLVIVLFACVTSIGSSEPVDADSLAQYIHPKAGPTVKPTPSDSTPSLQNALSPHEAINVSIPLFLTKGISDLQICEQRWIAAPFPGFLIDALGTLRENGTGYTVFRLGIHDGADEQFGPMYAAGNEFVFLALGFDSTGSPVWRPDPGPDASPEEITANPDGYLSYEFLLQREEFESLPERFPLPVDGKSSEE